MRAGERSYSKGEIIYRAGEPCDAVYVVVSGRVELFREDSDGAVVTGRVGPIEMFGETDVLHEGPRESGARAMQKTVVKRVPRDEFMVWVQNEPNAGIRVLGLLVERLRAADAIITHSREGGEVFGPPAEGLGWSLIQALRAWLRYRKHHSQGGGLSDGAKPFSIGIAIVNNDVEEAWTRALAGLLEERFGISVRVLSVSLQLDPGADQNQVNAVVLRARQILAREAGLDLLVWGDVHADGYSLWFTPAGQGDEERPGCFSPYLSLELPGDQEPPAGDMFYLIVLAAIEPMTEAQRGLQHELLVAAQQALPAMPDDLPVSWNIDQQRTVLTCYGLALATIAGLEPDPGWYDVAGDAYNAAINRLPQDDHGIEEALLHKYWGNVLSAVSERRQDVAALEQAVEEYRASVECLVKASYPLEWGGAYNRLGQALYKLDLATGQPNLLKEAMGAFQAALQVYTRTESPQRWADVMNNLAQVLQVYGDQVKSPEVLERAVDACRAALEFRARNRTPLGWASCQNTLGTALFLLDKHRQSTEHLDEAAAAYTGALEVYRQMGATRQAAIAEKNLAHVERLNKIRVERRVALPDWGDD
ncbi:cyclic nucleotide-binding domain-containing protein [Telmatospirillum siberiense]|uniref:cyclic nucleotide-binding domain-containing protein n=1 Tax=Telmatospirillum siberiense TaxID=382514 RepID=UPI0013046A99|nr:cyclic nucleotide-binding domain-containing protein [Telmatospirillum siberiense]